LQVGDFEELKAITLVFCKDRKTPLLIESAKSKMEYAEETAGLCDVTKVVTDMKAGSISPNLQYNNPREDVNSLMNGQLR
jgi:fatty acid synthase